MEGVGAIPGMPTILNAESTCEPAGAKRRNCCSRQAMERRRRKFPPISVG